MVDLNLRQQVAERLGWTDIHRSSTTPSMIGMIPPTASGKSIGPFNIPAYDSDIAAAWKLLSGLDYQVGDAPDEDMPAIATIWTDSGETHTGQAPTAPAAICKAWLAYMESKHG